MTKTYQAQIINDKIYICDEGDWVVIHDNHSIPDALDEILDDVYNAYVVFEYATNYPLLHGVMAPSADEALEEVASAIHLNDGESAHLIGVGRLDFTETPEMEENT